MYISNDCIAGLLIESGTLIVGVVDIYSRQPDNHATIDSLTTITGKVKYKMDNILIAVLCSIGTLVGYFLSKRRSINILLLQLMCIWVIAGIVNLIMTILKG